MVAGLRDIGLGCDADVITVAAQSACLAWQLSSGLLAHIGIDAASPLIGQFGSFGALNIQRTFAGSIHIFRGGLIGGFVGFSHFFSFSTVAS